jgi:hypothetical protein
MIAGLMTMSAILTDPPMKIPAMIARTFRNSFGIDFPPQKLTSL